MKTSACSRIIGADVNASANGFYMDKINSKVVYKASFTAGALLIKESREIAALLLTNPSPKEWRHTVYVENVLQKKAAASAKGVANMIRNRLRTMPSELWQMVVDSPNDTATQLLLACSLKESRLLGDFMRNVLRKDYCEFKTHLSHREWGTFLEECRSIDSSVESWSESTRYKLGEIVFRILAEAKYIESVRNPKLQTVIIFPEVHRFLEQYDEKYILNCMDVTNG